MNEEEAKERVERYIKSFNGNALDCIAIGTVLTLLEKKDKMIDLMAEELYIEMNCYANPEEVKQYFENKVTDTNVGERKVENGNYKRANYNNEYLP